ncbi:MAG: methylenetetrahydrofolate reductase [NAD(P)H] [Synergistaceae bacterium]|nr:methylenetetrahydrofolate reductase [NAD(P)H] [Synergistaceae bacterium]MDD4444985.1 methylenetetrahydrofolate reductase [NAD(P)H] [Eubacteriales bacterium]
MKITELIQSSNPSLSFEVFPPKSSDSYETTCAAAREIARLSPSFMSITYGAGGGTSDYTVSIAAQIQQHHIPTLAHLSCINASRENITHQLDLMRQAGIKNVLALRGDAVLPCKKTHQSRYRYASQLMETIRAYGGFCVGGACYPEMHTESRNQAEDIMHLKEKQDAGCGFLITQMVFDNHVYYNFLCKLRDAGVHIPVIPGIMPVINATQIQRITTLSGATLPQRFRYIVDRFGNDAEAMKQAGIAYATEQIVDLLANGATAVHIYSMNNASVAAKICENLSEILRYQRGVVHEN